MYTWQEEISNKLCCNGEQWSDIEYTPFAEKELSMLTDDCNGDMFFSGCTVVAYTKDWVYYVGYDMEYGRSLVHSVPRHPEVLAEVVRREEAIRQIAQSLTAMK